MSHQCGTSNRMLAVGVAVIAAAVMSLLADSAGSQAWGQVTATAPGYHGAVGRNLLPNPDFEIGSTGWLYLTTWASSTKHYTSAERKPALIVQGAGVDGGACLFMQGPSYTVRSYSVPIVQGETYTVSMYLKAPEGVDTADISVLMIEPDWQVPLWAKQGEIGKEWKQYSWTFVWDKNCKQKKAYLNLGSSTGVMVDRVMVARGEDKTYEAPVMMALKGDRLPYFIRGRDKAEMKICVAPGNLYSGDAQVVVTARDAWKQVVWSKTVGVTLDKVTEEPITLPTDVLGNFHVEFQAVQDGKVIGQGVSRYTIMDSPAKAAVSEGKPSPFGICYEAYAWPTWANEIYAGILNDTGPQFSRFFAKAPTDLTYPFPKEFIERQVALVKPLHEAGIELMGCIQFFPGSFQCGNTAEMPSEEELASYRKCVKAYVKALSPYIRYWEIFNEPDLWRDSAKKKRAFSPEKYFQVQKAAYEAIKEADPKLVVVCNALNTFRWKWMEDWFKAGGCQYMDDFSFHPYRSHPDQLNEIGVYKDIMQARAMLDQFGGQRLGMINSEQLYGSALFNSRQSTNEIHRGYYVDNDHELEAASRQTRNLIHHAAAGATVCPFTFRDEFAYLGPDNALLVTDSVPAYNAATRFLAEAGRGEPVDMGESLRAFVFADAKGGPLLAVWTPVSDAHGVMRLSGKYQVFDIMGNPRPEMAASQTLKFSTDPVWVRFTTNESLASISKALHSAPVQGISDPMKVDMAITGKNELTVYLTSMLNESQSGQVKLTQLPAGWKIAGKSARFEDLAAGKTAAVKFAFADMPLDVEQAYEVGVEADSSGGPIVKTQTMRPFFAGAGADRIKADGDVSDWAGVPMMTLSDANVSKDFTAGLHRAGDADLSAKVSVAWSAEAVAFLVIVTDDRNVVEANPATAYQGDCVQLYIDQRNDATDAAANMNDDVSYTLTLDHGKPVAWISKGAEGNFKGDANQKEDLADPEAKIAIKRTGNTTVYELVLPRAASLPNVTLKAGGGFGFSLLINDSDGKGRKTGLTLSPKGGEPYGRPAEYRDLILMSSGETVTR